MANVGGANTNAMGKVIHSAGLALAGPLASHLSCSALASDDSLLASTALTIPISCFPWDVLHLIISSPVVQDNGLCTILQSKVAFEVIHPACE
jgi:hypothetical protein